MPGTIQIKIEDIVPQFVQLARRGKKNIIFKNTMNALEWLSTKYQEVWTAATMGAALPGLPFVINSRNYQRTIRRRQISPTVWEVYTDYSTRTGKSVTELLEKGHGLIDLKPGLLHGPKSRSGKKGRYNIVAFRQGSPGSDVHHSNPMPFSVYKEFRQMMKDADSAKRTGATQTGGASYTSKAGNTWGAKYSKDSDRGLRSKLIQSKGKRVGEYTWKAGKYAGMVGLQQSTTKAKRTGYMTFRVVSAGSNPMSWIVPEQPPWPVRKAVIDAMQEIAEQTLQEAMQEDIK